MMSNRELWERALTVESQHGDQIHLFITERIGTFAFEGDMEGLAFWQQIAARIDQLAACRRQ